MSLSEEKQSEVIEAFSSTSRYLDDLLNIDNNYLNKLWVFRWVRIAHPLLLICSCFVMIETSWCLFPLKTNLKSLKLLARLQDIWIIY